MKTGLRWAVGLIGVAPLAVIAILVPVDWRPAALAILGGLSGIVWSFIQYLDQTRVTPVPRRGFVTFFFAFYAFACLAAAEVVDTLSQHK